LRLPRHPDKSGFLAMTRRASTAKKKGKKKDD